MVWCAELRVRSAIQSRLSVHTAKYDSMLTAVSSNEMSTSRPTPVRWASKSPTISPTIAA